MIHLTTRRGRHGFIAITCSLREVHQGATIKDAAESNDIPVGTVASWIKRYFGSVPDLRKLASINYRLPDGVKRSDTRLAVEKVTW